MKNIIEFPESKSQKAKKEKRQNAQQAILSLSMVTLIMGALLLNDSVQKKNSIYIVSDNSNSGDFQNLNRAIASAQPMNPFRDLAWEKSLAEKLSRESATLREPASISKKVDPIEQIRYGILEGKYLVHELRTSDGLKISELQYKDSDDITAGPVVLSPEQFLKSYGDQLAIKFSSFDRSNHMSQDLVQEFRLLGQQKEVLGLVSFAVDEEGHLISMKLKSGPQ